MLTSCPLAAGLLGSDNYFMDSFHRYIHPSAFKSLWPNHSLPPSLSLSPNCRLCFTNRAVIWFLRGIPLSALASCQAGSAVPVYTRGTLVSMHIHCRNTHEHAHNNSHADTCMSVSASTRQCSRWPHLDPTRDTSLAPSQLIELDRWVCFESLCMCACAYSRSDTYFIRGCSVWVKLGHEGGQNTPRLNVSAFLSSRWTCVLIPLPFSLLLFFLPFSFPFTALSFSPRAHFRGMSISITQTQTRSDRCAYALTKGRQTDHLSHLRTLSV